MADSNNEQPTAATATVNGGDGEKAKIAATVNGGEKAIADGEKAKAVTLKSADGEKAEMVTLMSADGEMFEVKVSVAEMSETVHHLIQVLGTGAVIPIANVYGASLAKVVEYCRKHDRKGAWIKKEELDAWDLEFVAVDLDSIHDLFLAADYLEIKGLLDLLSETIAAKIRGRTPDEIRSIFKITNDFAPEVYEEIRKEIRWAFE